MADQLPFLPTEAPMLHQRSVEVDPTSIGTPEFQKFLDELIDTTEQVDGAGMAAPQVGRPERIFVVMEHGIGNVYINPEVTLLSDLTENSEEGCFSVPGVWGIVKRAKKIRIKAINRHNREVEKIVKGFPAFVFQHEFDHLNGVLFIDKVVKITQGSKNIRI